MTRRSFYLLKCPVQKYHWGSISRDSILRHIAFTAHEAVLEDEPAAELWMGAHPSGPSVVVPEEESLAEVIARDPDYHLGHKGHLSFLFKILHADRPLSIQAHPDRTLAKSLHARDPKNYPDPNHKPELAMCIQDMRALVGFRNEAEIKRELERHAALLEICGGIADGLRGWYAKLMRAEGEAVARAAERVRSAISREPEEMCFLDLCGIYGERDPGIFAPFFLNYMEFEHGDAIFLGPNEPHSYLGGEILECMAASDNVVRAGLTTKYCDVDTLLSMLHYRTGPHSVIRPIEDERGLIYPVPVPDFALHRVDRLIHRSGPAIVLALKGAMQINGEMLSSGNAVFIPHGAEVSLSPAPGAEIYTCSTSPGYTPETP